MQVPLIAIQKVLPETQVAEGTSIIIFIQTFGGSIFLAVAQSVFNNTLISNVLAQRIPVSPGALLSEGATQLANLVGPEYLDRLRLAYNDSITQVLLARGNRLQTVTDFGLDTLRLCGHCCVEYFW